MSTATKNMGGIYRFSKKTRVITGRTIAYIVLISFSIICVIPFIWMVSTSLKPPGAVFVQPPQWIPERFYWINYYSAFTIVPFMRFFRNTMIIVVFSLLGSLISTSLTAYGFARIRFKGREILFGILLSTMMIPWEVIVVPLYVQYNWMGWIDTFLPFIIPSFFGIHAFSIFLLRQYLMTIPYDLDEAALLDGCSRLGILLKILIPIAKPALVTVSIFHIVFSWNDFMGPLIFLNRMDNFTLTLGLNLFRNSFLTEWDHLMAAATFVTIVPLIIFFIGQKQLIGGIATSGLKG